MATVKKAATCCASPGLLLLFAFCCWGKKRKDPLPKSSLDKEGVYLASASRPQSITEGSEARTQAGTETESIEEPFLLVHPQAHVQLAYSHSPAYLPWDGASSRLGPPIHIIIQDSLSQTWPGHNSGDNFLIQKPSGSEKPECD